MKNLQRPPLSPVCLSNCDYNVDEWSKSKPNANGRRSIWKRLFKMQGGYCCYCESIAVKGKGHIEHFFHKGIKPDGSAPYRYKTFDWDNLFGCCGLYTSDTCGHYKDREGARGPGHYDPTVLIKPDIDNPSDFFEFLPTGVIIDKPGLSDSDKHRAKETLRVLNLNKLNGVRKRQIDIFKNEVDALCQLGVDQQTLIQEIEKIKNKIRTSEFKTAVLNALF